MRTHCYLCGLTACSMCAKYYLDRRVRIQPSAATPNLTDKDKLIQELTSYVSYLLAENEKLYNTVEEFMKKEFEELESKGKAKMVREQPEVATASEGEEAYVLIAHKEKGIISATQAQVPVSIHIKIVNGLFNFKVQFTIQGVESFEVNAILDTGATKCCIDPSKIPEAAFEKSKWPVKVHGVNSVTITDRKLKDGYLAIAENKFRIPFTYALPMGMHDGVQMLVGCNFIRSNMGGIRLEGSNITFYKNISSIDTRTESIKADIAIPELEMEEEEFLMISELALYNTGSIPEVHGKRISAALEGLEQAGFIRKDPQKHRLKNKVTCRLDIINPDLTIQDKPLKHVTPAMADQFRRHTEALLSIGVIRPSDSKHRTMAIMVNSGTTIDPKTGKEIRGKEKWCTTTNL